MMSKTRVKLRAITEQDLPDYVRWFSDPEVTEFLSIESGTLTLEHEREWLARISAPDEASRHWAIEMDGRHVGNCALTPEAGGETAGFGIAIGDKTAWDQGCGTAALREVLRIGFAEMGLHRLHLEAFSRNARAIRCYEKCGLRREGYHRKARLKRGEWQDMVSMAILRDEWEAPCAGTSATAEPDLRCYRGSDHDQVVDLWASIGLGPDFNDTREALDYKRAHDGGPFLVAEANGRVIGTAMASWDGRWAWVYRVAVDPEHRRCSVGRELMSEIERRLAALGAERAYLITGADNQVAIEFYRSLGYEIRDGLKVMRKLFEPREEACCGH